MNKTAFIPFWAPVAIILVTIALPACANRATDRPGVNEPGIETPLSPSGNSVFSQADSLMPGQPDMARMYARAIEAYMGAVGQKDSTGFDTLFIGKIFDFPDITLPATINGTKILLLTQEEVNSKKSVYRQTAPYINLMGFVENDNAEFIFVTFYPGFNHQYDYYINYRYNPEKEELEPQNSRIEVLIHNQNGAPDHFAVFENGKYTGDKPAGKN